MSESETDSPRNWRGVADAAAAGARLDAWLAARLDGLSRMRVKGLIEAGRVLVGGRPAKASYRLQPGDQVEVSIPPPRFGASLPEIVVALYGPVYSSPCSPEHVWAPTGSF